MARQRGVIYVHGPDYFCHCTDRARCGEVHATDEDEGFVTDLATGDTYDAAEFRETHR